MLAVSRGRSKKQRAVGASLWDAGACVEGAGAGGAAQPPPAPSPGLSLAHSYSREEKNAAAYGVLHVAKNGFVSHLRRPRLAGRRVVAEGVKRGKVKGLSRAAAARCRRKLLAVDQSRVLSSFFCANTLPQGEFTYPEFKRFVKRWRDRFERQFPGVPCPWVIEFTEKREPHLHFIPIWPIGKPMPTVQRFREWNLRAWAACVRSKHDRHRVVGGSADLCSSFERSVTYISGYLEKGAEEETEVETGKMWGVIGRKFLPVAEEQVELTKGEFHWLQRRLVQRRRKQAPWLHSQSSHDNGRSMGKPTKWRRVKRVIPVDSVQCIQMRSMGLRPPAPEIAEVVQWFKSNGFRVRQVRVRPYRRRGVKVFDFDETTRKLERRRYVEPKLFRKWNPETGATETEYVDEIESIACAWHYLDSSIVLRMVEYLRRPRSGLTACERRWAGESEIGK